MHAGVPRAYVDGPMPADPAADGGWSGCRRPGDHAAEDPAHHHRITGFQPPGVEAASVGRSRVHPGWDSAASRRRMSVLPSHFDRSSPLGSCDRGARRHAGQWQLRLHGPGVEDLDRRDGAPVGRRGGRPPGRSADRSPRPGQLGPTSTALLPQTSDTGSATSPSGHQTSIRHGGDFRSRSTQVQEIPNSRKPRAGRRERTRKVQRSMPRSRRRTRLWATRLWAVDGWSPLLRWPTWRTALPPPQRARLRNRRSSRGGPHRSGPPLSDTPTVRRHRGRQVPRVRPRRGRR